MPLIFLSQRGGVRSLVADVAHAIYTTATFSVAYSAISLAYIESTLSCKMGGAQKIGACHVLVPMTGAAYIELPLYYCSHRP